MGGFFGQQISFYQINNNNGEFDIDFWPQIDPYFEIESDDEKKVEFLFSQFGYSMEDVTSLNVDDVYRNIYGIELDKIKSLKFSEEDKDYLTELKRRIIDEYTKRNE